MRSPILLAAAALSSLVAPSLGAQTGGVHSHIAYVVDASPDTPTGQGLLPTAAAEAAVVAQHAELAAAAAFSLDDVRLHIGHLLHAIDPTWGMAGPGLGYGVRQATAAAATHIEQAAADATASDNVRTHAVHVLACIASARDRAEAIVALAEQIQRGGSVAAVTPLLTRLTELSEGLVRGRDLDGDGRVGWQSGEGGLRQAMQHMALMKRGERLTP
jgi:hypothetical protein